MASFVHICPNCKHVQFVDTTCEKCGSPVIVSDYTDVYWNKCDAEKQEELAESILQSKDLSAKPSTRSTAITIRGLKCGHQDISSGFLSTPNSAGGVSVKGTYQNNSSKTIKYITIRFVPYNAVNDAVSCTIKGLSEYGLQCTGPDAPQTSHQFFGENMWYNNSIKTVKVSGADIEYMDGTKLTLSASDINVDTSSGGCYVATAIYGSYDCPQVWTLRRYRDDTLAGTWYGRSFIRLYYAISPTLVKWFGHTTWFKKMWQGKLDRMVADLNSRGVLNTPYEDRHW